jgi:hypothetical protein
MEWINWIGLVLNFIGSVMVVASIGRLRQADLRVGDTIHFPRSLQYGFILLAAGFVLQLVAAWPG